jgi:colicin import membrane protein
MRKFLIPAALLVIGMAGCSVEPATEAVDVPTNAEASVADAPVEAPAPDPFAGETVSQKNARQKAGDYLDYSAFSSSSLVNQLEFEGFSTDDSSYAVFVLQVDWNEQAALKAADYLEYSSFSRSGLIDQLIFEGFTPEQAAYGVSTTGL